MQPLNLPTHCDGCGERFSTEHGLNCKHGGIVNERHDDVTDKWEHLAMLTWQPGAVLHKPMVRDGNMTNRNNNNNNNTGGAAEAPALAPILHANGGAGSNNSTNNNGAAIEGATGPTLEPDLEGGKGVQDFWKHGCECIFDIRITNTGLYFGVHCILLRCFGLLRVVVLHLLSLACVVYSGGCHWTTKTENSVCVNNLQYTLFYTSLYHEGEENVFFVTKNRFLCLI